VGIVRSGNLDQTLTISPCRAVVAAVVQGVAGFLGSSVCSSADDTPDLDILAAEHLCRPERICLGNRGCRAGHAGDRTVDRSGLLAEADRRVTDFLAGFAQWVEVTV
jgi:hypothetical protein